MGRLAKCKGCSKELQKEERHVHSSKTYCINCYNIKIKESEDYENLIAYVCKCFNQPKPTGLILKQIKDYKESFDYTYAGIHYCLWYLVEIKNMKLDIKYGIGIVKFEYEKARDYFLQQQNIKQSAQMQVSEPVEVVRSVKIKNKRKIDNRFLINIDDLLSDKE